MKKEVTELSLGVRNCSFNGVNSVDIFGANRVWLSLKLRVGDGGWS